MSPVNRVDEEEALKYLLGSLDEPRIKDIEERVFLDDDYYQFVLGVEEQMVRDYVAGELTAADRADFERHYLAAPAHREKVALARALRDAGSARLLRSAEPSAAGSGSLWSALPAALATRTPGFRWAMALSTAMAIVGALSLIAFSLTERKALLDERAQFISFRSRAAAENRRLTAELHSSSSAGVATFLLTPVLRAGDGEAGNRLLLSSGVSHVILNLDLPASAAAYSGFQASVSDVDSQALVWSGNLPRATETPSGRCQLALRLDSVQTPDGDYRVELAGARAGGTVEKLPSFSFSLRRR